MFAFADSSSNGPERIRDQKKHRHCLIQNDSGYNGDRGGVAKNHNRTSFPQTTPPPSRQDICHPETKSSVFQDKGEGSVNAISFFL